MMFTPALHTICCLLFFTVVGCVNAEDDGNTEPHNNSNDEASNEATATPKGKGRARPRIEITPSKMNVLYIGVDNPIDVTSVGISSNELALSISGEGNAIKKIGPRQYIIHVVSPGEVTVEVKANKVYAKHLFRAKKVPDPIARLNNSAGGEMKIGEFKAQAGLGASLDDFDFEVRTAIEGFKLTYVGRRADPVSVVNQGARFLTATKRLISQAKPGDIYIFHDVKARCPGDKVARNVNTLAFMIK